MYFFDIVYVPLFNITSSIQFLLILSSCIILSIDETGSVTGKTLDSEVIITELEYNNTHFSNFSNFYI